MEEAKKSNKSMVTALIVVFIAGFLLGMALEPYISIDGKNVVNFSTGSVVQNYPADNGISDPSAAGGSAGGCEAPENNADSNIQDGYLKAKGDNSVLMVKLNDSDIVETSYATNAETKLSRILFKQGEYVGEDDLITWDDLVFSDFVIEATPVSAIVACNENDPSDCVLTDIRVITNID